MEGAERTKPRPGVSKQDVYERKANPVVPGESIPEEKQGSKGYYENSVSVGLILII